MCHPVQSDSEGNLCVKLQYRAFGDGNTFKRCVLKLLTYRSPGEYLLHYNKNQSGKPTLNIQGECSANDLLVPWFRPFAHIHPNGMTTQCLVLRPLANGIHNVVGFSLPERLPKRLEYVGWDDNIVSDDTMRLYFDVKDLVSLTLHVTVLRDAARLIGRAAQKNKNQYKTTGGCVVDENCRYNVPLLGFGTFGVLVRRNQVPEEINGIASLDGRTIPCAACGGLIHPSADASKSEESDVPGIDPSSLAEY